jgi:hypothetical protein
MAFLFFSEGLFNLETYGIQGASTSTIWQAGWRFSTQCYRIVRTLGMEQLDLG